MKIVFLINKWMDQFCVGIWAFDSRLWCHTQKATVSSLVLPPRVAHRWWGRASHQVPKAGWRPGPGDLSPSVAAALLCWLAPCSLRAPSCMCHACSVCRPPSTVPALSGKEDLPSAHVHTRPALRGNPGRSRPAWMPPMPVAGGVWGPRVAAPRICR